MIKNQNEKKVSEGQIYFNKNVVGRSLKEVAVDLIRTENDDVVSRWYRGSDGTTSAVDLFTWADKKNNIIKQQLNFNGEIVEWNCLEGIKTGLVIEHELEISDVKAEEKAHRPSEIIKFDKNPMKDTVTLALAILESTEIDQGVRIQLIGNFRDPQHIDTMEPDLFVKRFGLSMKNHGPTDQSFWQGLRKSIANLFK